MPSDLLFGVPTHSGVPGVSLLQHRLWGPYLRGEVATGHHPIILGADSFRISGRKGAIVNWLVAYGTQVVSISRDPGFAAYDSIHLVLRKPSPAMHEVVGEAMGRLAGPFLPHVALGALLHAPATLAGGLAAASSGLAAAREAHEHAASAVGAIRSAGDAWESMGETTGGGCVKHYSAPWLTAPKILDIQLGYARDAVTAADREMTLKVVKLRGRDCNFSSIASWMFGS